MVVALEQVLARVPVQVLARVLLAQGLEPVRALLVQVLLVRRQQVALLLVQLLLASLLLRQLVWRLLLLTMTITTRQRRFPLSNKLIHNPMAASLACSHFSTTVTPALDHL
ncbi:hypothetical protein [Salinivibrio sp. IB282]|uniref:hypothetical protein n=1 Tax=Salinivibrio sp. IB282 TaxID=1766122 RepID=UPI00130159D7|nr:hypothetical protein [Salinivibrio sp. IB282]